jgi:adenylate cyclase class 2
VSGRTAHTPHRNVELKARDGDPGTSLAICRRIGAEDRGEIHQVDTYFHVPSGGLKLREENPGRPHLVQFARADEPRERESRYWITEVADAPALLDVLGAALGIRAVVVKRRRLFLWRDVRIHLDAVEGLGTFVELEAVAAPESDLTAEHRRVVELRGELGITDERLVATGYADQLLALWGSRTSHSPGQRTAFGTFAGGQGVD